MNSSQYFRAGSYCFSLLFLPLSSPVSGFSRSLSLENDAARGGSPGPEALHEPTPETRSPEEKSVADIPKALSKEEAGRICKGLGKEKITYISFYDTFYLVRNCQRSELGHEEVKRLTKRGVVFHDVGPNVIEALPLKPKKKRIPTSLADLTALCQKYTKSYLSLDFSEVYWVEADGQGCVKRPFPEWSSYESHAGKPGHKRRKLLSPPAAIFYNIPLGKPMPSVFDKNTGQGFLDDSDQPDLLPLAEACKGLIGQYATYLGEIYQIIEVPGVKGSGQHCRRRIIDSEKFTRERGLSGFRLPELSSSQALSIPVG